MSTARAALGRLDVRGRVLTARTFALLGAAGLLFSWLSVLYGIVDVAGRPTVFVALVGVVLVAATLLSRVLRVVVAIVVAVLALAAGLALYLFSLPYDPQVGAIIESNVELLTGRNLLQIKLAAVWALSVAPAPAFVTWYLALRRWYVGAALVGSATLGYLVLTGDAGTTVTLLGVVSAAGLVGFGDVDSRDASTGAAEAVAVVLAVMVLAPGLVTAVPAGGGGPITVGDGGTTTVEASLMEDDARLDIAGDISLSPEVRFSVTSPQGDYWRVGSYQRYTGDGWMKVGENQPYVGQLDSPVGPNRWITQRVQVESPLQVMPATWRPVMVGPSIRNRTMVTAAGSLQPEDTLAPGESYRVTSAVVRVSPTELADAGRNYPERVQPYTQLPASTPDRVARRTEQLTQNADNPYEIARTIERWLESHRSYSLDVDRPEGNIAAAFLFEMERGYCVYYATTMVVMLRTQGIPARMVTGYTTGQQVDGNTWVVRGYNAHAWVEVYFPDTGWVRFDPTPAGPRRQAERERLAEARDSGTTNVDTNATRPTPTPTPTPSSGTPTPTSTPDPANGTDTPTRVRGLGPHDQGDSGGGFQVPDLPSREQVALGFVVVAGAVAGLRRTGLHRSARWWVHSRFGRQSEPERDIERAFEHLSYLMERRYRARKPWETVRSYLEAVDADSRARRVAEIRERARYGGEASRELAEEAHSLVREYRREGG